MKLFSALCIMALLGQLWGCTPDPDRKFHDAMENYAAGTPGAERTLADLFIANIAIDSIKGTELQSGGTCIYAIDENSVDIVYPRDCTVSLPGGQAIRQVDINDTYIVLHDGLKFGIFDSDGDLIHEESVGDPKSPLRSLVISGDDIIYYKNSLLYRYNITDRSTEPLTEEAFPPPYASYYTAQLYTVNDMLCLLTGIAGAYYFNILSSSNASVELKNLKMSSSKHHAGPGSLFYITGNSGKWELVRYSLAVKSKRSLKRFSDISDIELASGGCAWESGTGLWFSQYGKEAIRVPFPYLLAGKYKGRVLLQYGKRYYFIDMKKMSAALALLKEKAPGLWNDK